MTDWSASGSDAVISTMLVDFVELIRVGTNSEVTKARWPGFKASFPTHWLAAQPREQASVFSSVKWGQL